MREVIITWKSKETLNDLQVKQAKAENALETIKGLTDIPCSDINNLTLPSVKAFCAQKIAEVDRASFLTTSTKLLRLVIKPSSVSVSNYNKQLEAWSK